MVHPGLGGLFDDQDFLTMVTVSRVWRTIAENVSNRMTMTAAAAAAAAEGADSMTAAEGAPDEAPSRAASLRAMCAHRRRFQPPWYVDLVGGDDAADGSEARPLK